MGRSRFGTSACLAGALAVTLALGALLPAGAGATPQEVREELAGAEAPANSLDLADRVPLDDGAVVYRFDQEVGGVPVAGGEAIVLDPAGEGAELVGDDTAAGLDPPAATAVSERRAVRTAVTATGAESLLQAPGAELVLDPEADGAPAWLVTVASARPAGDFEVLVDATTGAVTDVRDQSWSATGSASIFLPNAVVENGGYGVYGDPAGTFPIRDRGDRDSDALKALRTATTLENLNERRPCLKGTHAEARVGSKAKRVCRKGRNWNGITRGSGRFEALMAYHHIDQTQEYLLELGAPGVDDKRQLVVANAMAADQSAFYPSADVIRLGTGGVDDGEDGDVIVHEYGHAVLHSQRPGFGSRFQARAIGEAFGDYLAAAVSEERWLTSGEWSVCVMEWDAVSYDSDTPDSPGICLRRTDVDSSVAEQELDCGGGDYHCLGQAWSSALWDLRQLLGDDGSGRSIGDRVVMNAQPLFGRGTSFAEAAQNLINADEALYGSGDHCTEIRAEMIERGFLTSHSCA